MSSTKSCITIKLRPGLDIAFFRPRAFYHTPQDSIPNFSQGSLQHMLGNTLATVDSLAHARSFELKGRPIFFDFLGAGFAEMRLSSALWISLVLLLAGPWALGAGLALRMKQMGKYGLAGVGLATASILSCFILTLVVLFIFSLIRPDISYAQSNTVFAFSMLVSFTAIYLTTRLPFATEHLRFYKTQYGLFDVERMATWELAIFWYILLFVTSILGVAQQIASFYFVPLSFLAYSAAALLTLVEPATLTHRNPADQDTDERAPLLRCEEDDDDEVPRDDDEVEAAPNLQEDVIEEEDNQSLLHHASHWIWLLRFLLSVPIPMIFSLEVVVWMIMPALNQVSADGVPPQAAWVPIALFTALININLIPFTTRLPLNRTLPTLLVLLVSIFTAPLRLTSLHTHQSHQIILSAGL